MATARDIINRALKRIRVLNSTESASGTDASDGLDALNDMMHGWKSDGVDVNHSDFTLASTFEFFVPPIPTYLSAMSEGRIADALHKQAYKGTWDADANSPALVSGTGTSGDLYKVGTAGSTTLDGNTSWVLNDYILFDGQNWLKGRSSRVHEQGVVAMLAVRLAEDYGLEPRPLVLRDADKGWDSICGDFIVPGLAQFDDGLAQLPSQRYIDYTS